MWGGLVCPRVGTHMGATLGANPLPLSPPPNARCGFLPARSRVTSRARAAERAGHHQRRESTRAWVDEWGEVCSHPTAPRASTTLQLYPAPLLLLAPNLEKQNRMSRRAFRGATRGLPGAGRGRGVREGPAPAPPARHTTSPLPSPRQLWLLGLRGPPPRGSSQGGGGARSGAGAAGPGGAAREGGRGEEAGGPGRALRSYAGSARGDPGRRPRPLTWPQRGAACRPRDPQAPPDRRLRGRAASTRVGGRPRRRGRAGLARLRERLLL